MPYGESAKFVRKTDYARYGGVIVETVSGDPTDGPFHIELGAGALDLSAPCEYWSKRDGNLERFYVRALVQPRDPFNSSLDLVEGIDEVNNFITQQLEEINWQPPRFFSLPKGKAAIVPQGESNTGDVYIADQFGGERVVFADCIITDQRFEDDDSLPSGFGFIEWEFTRVAEDSWQDKLYPRFLFRDGGVGSQTGLVELGTAGSGIGAIVPWLTTYEIANDGIFQKLTVTTPLVNNGTDLTHAQRASMVARAALFSTFPNAGVATTPPFYTKPLVRRDKLGKGIMLNWANNFGDLVFADNTNAGTVEVATVLQNCQLTSLEVIDSQGDAGISLQWVFQTIPASHQIERRYWTFTMNDGSGDINITPNDPDAAWQYEYVKGASGARIQTCTIKCFYFNDHGNQTLHQVQQRVLDIGASLKFREPLKVNLARGRLDMPDVYDNFGDLYIDTTFGGKTNLVFEDCVLMRPPRVVDNIGEAGVVFELQFGKPYAGATL